MRQRENFEANRRNGLDQFNLTPMGQNFDVRVKNSDTALPV